MHMSQNPREIADSDGQVSFLDGYSRRYGDSLWRRIFTCGTIIPLMGFFFILILICSLCYERCECKSVPRVLWVIPVNYRIWQSIWIPSCETIWIMPTPWESELVASICSEITCGQRGPWRLGSAWMMGRSFQNYLASGVCLFVRLQDTHFWEISQLLLFSRKK